MAKRVKRWRVEMSWKKSGEEAAKREAMLVLILMAWCGWGNIGSGSVTVVCFVAGS